MARAPGKPNRVERLVAARPVGASAAMLKREVGTHSPRQVGPRRVVGMEAEGELCSDFDKGTFTSRSSWSGPTCCIIRAAGAADELPPGGGLRRN
jgi:hypothetical protein